MERSMAEKVTRAQRLDALCAKYKGRYERTGGDGQPVTLFLTLGSGSRVAGTGATTEEALASLEAKLEEVGDAL
jgi:hypothetical protein